MLVRLASRQAGTTLRTPDNSTPAGSDVGGLVRCSALREDSELDGPAGGRVAPGRLALGGASCLPVGPEMHGHSPPGRLAEDQPARRPAMTTTDALHTT